MNQSLILLQNIADKKSRTVLGLMSGTSADGLDISLSKISGSGVNTRCELMEFETVDYTVPLKQLLQAVLFDETAEIAHVLELQSELEREWVQLIQNQLEKWGDAEIDLIASHGQTVLHLPKSADDPAKSFQLVDGDQLAVQLGAVTISDFRQKHIAAGFEGAPLAPLGEQLLVKASHQPAVLLNLGGIANFTWLTPDEHIPFSTDTGPANTLIDAAVMAKFPGQTFDDGGDIAASGTVQPEFLEKLKEHPFYKIDAPKSTGPEAFSYNWLQKQIETHEVSISAKDLVATLTRFTVWGVAREIRENVNPIPQSLYVSGGGWHNKTMIRWLAEELDGVDILSSNEIGIEPDAKEALLFSVLANELVAGEGWKLSGGKRLTLGKISLPLLDD